MKKIFLFLVLAAVVVIGCEEEALIPTTCDYIDFRYYGDSTLNLGLLSNDYLFVACDSSYSNTDIDQFIASSSFFDPNYDYTISAYPGYRFKSVLLKLNGSRNCEIISAIIGQLEEEPIVSYAHHTIQTAICGMIGITEYPCVNSYSSLFYVKVFDENDLTDLNTMISATNTTLVEQNAFMPKWFTVQVTKASMGHTVKMANYFYESGLFEASEPDIVNIPVSE